MDVKFDVNDFLGVARMVHKFNESINREHTVDYIFNQMVALSYKYANQKNSYVGTMGFLLTFSRYNDVCSVNPSLEYWLVEKN